MTRNRFPLDQPFEKQLPTTVLSSVAFRLVSDFYQGKPRVVGTATLICGHLLITAKHVLQDILGEMPNPQEGEVGILGGLVAVQIENGKDYVIWDVVEAIATPAADLMYLRLDSNPARSNHDSIPPLKQPIVNPFPPMIGDRVAAFGYRLGDAVASTNNEGGLHIDLNDEPMISVGVVREIYELRCDSLLRPFPCYQVSARFDGGMSGGPVFTESGALAGIICSGIAGAEIDGEPISYVSTLWPMFGLLLSADRGDDYPRGIRYAAIELVFGDFIRVKEKQRLIDWCRKMYGPTPSWDQLNKISS